MSEQLFFDFGKPSRPPKTQNRSRSEIFYDYDGFVEKFKKANLPKTTDETYTPEDVYREILRWLGPKIEGRRIVRPFWPGGDNRREEYTADDVVCDNPPFSQITEIARFYHAQGIDFFLFANGLTSLRLIRFGTVIFVGAGLRFENGATVLTSFVTSLFPGVDIMLAPDLGQAIADCDSQVSREAKRTRYVWPRECLGAGELNTLCKKGKRCSIAKGDLDFAIKEHGASFFGDRVLLSSRALSVIENAEIIQLNRKILSVDPVTIQLGAENLRRLRDLENR